MKKKKDHKHPLLVKKITLSNEPASTHRRLMKKQKQSKTVCYFACQSARAKSVVLDGIAKEVAYTFFLTA